MTQFIVFSKPMLIFTDLRTPQVYAELFNSMGINVLETHSRKSQGARTRVAEAFRNSKGVIMFTSDVSARGMDYPDVSLVVQVTGQIISFYCYRMRTCAVTMLVLWKS